MRMKNLAPRFAGLEQSQCWRMPSGVGFVSRIFRYK